MPQFRIFPGLRIISYLLTTAAFAASFGMLVDTLLDLDLINSETSNMTDEELAVMAKNSKAAAEALISRYSKLILIKSELFANDRTDSEDLRQEALMSLLKAASSFDPGRGVKFSTYCEVCISNRLRTVCAGSGKDPKFSESLDDVSESEALSVEETPESIFLYRETLSEISRTVDSVLSSAERRAFRLCMQGLSYRCTARRMGVSEKAVDNAMQRARKKIRAFVMQ